MDYFMHCPDRPPEPPDDDTAERRRLRHLRDLKEEYEGKIAHYQDLIEQVEQEALNNGWTFKSGFRVCFAGNQPHSWAKP